MWTPLDLPSTGEKQFTDYSRWRLIVNDGGRHTWTYLRTDEELEKWPQNEIDKFWLGQPTGLPDIPKATNALDAARNGYKFYKHLQSHDGHWAGEYGGPMFLLPGLVIGSYLTGMPFKQEERLEMIRYLFNRAHPDDGGWGIHVEGHSTVFGTGLNYTALRILGVDKDHPVCVRARAKLHQLGGCTSIPAWGKFWLSLLNVYDWAGNNPVPPELWALPDWLPFHPHKWWIHVRNVYIPMSYLYGVKYQMEENDLIFSLREELYNENYYKINWPAQCNNINKADEYAPHSALFNTISSILSVYELCTIPPLRRAGLKRAYQLIVMEDENTGYQTLGPVSKMFNLIARFHAEGSDSFSYKEHMLKRKDFMWIGAEGMMMCGTNGSQLWDVGFIVQALVETGLAEEEENKESLVKALEWLDQAQIRTNPKHYKEAYRHTTKGAWGFSTTEQGYTVSDCTGEGLKAAMYLQFNVEHTPKLISKERMCDAVDVMLTLQNPNGGFASYELVRGPSWLELLNPAEVFGNIMIEYCYPECTTSVITSLAIFRQHFPDYRTRDIDCAIKNAITYLHAEQQPEGGWIGSWGICITYATQFALESLSLVGETYETSERSRRACHFLIKMQREDGGWGESYKSCEQSRWIEHENTQVVQTCWATMSLMYAKYPHPEPIERAVQLVMSRQRPDGSWPQEAIEGVFNKTCAIAYPNFKFSFPIWMLGKAHLYLKELGKKKIPANGNGISYGNGHGANGKH
ncbi:terpenoid cyclases/protein prenyltransferase alpha-alpha toroid [Crepidotus variabilis]|uniref:Terpene cyclase/mutase family member n=1 Tax=Crepidotus variabilis TaxID=179855 RepID=A0A9P6JMT2_9AGAR|nr:terpenoid cyclases/protein prenyltransferase alpha-alpha toroid [Crepidotus variabilis]